MTDHDSGGNVVYLPAERVSAGELTGRPETPGTQGHHKPVLYADVTDERKPILPHWLQSWEHFHARRRWVQGRAWYEARFHGLRSPVYLVRLVFWTVVGAGRLVWKWATWWLVPVPPSVWHSTITTGPPGAWKSLQVHHRKVAKTRAWISAAVLTGATAAGVLTWVFVPLWGWIALAGAAVWALAHFGKPARAQIVTSSAPPAKYERLTQDIIVRALRSLGIGGIDRWVREGHEWVFPAPVRQDGPGWRADVDLPYGVTAAQVIEKRAQFASGLRRPLGAVWPQPIAAEHEGRLEVWVGQEDVSKTRQPPWPLLKSGQVDVFKSIPFGTDVRGRTVWVSVMFVAWLIGAIPRQGKTAAVRLLTCACALDPIVELWVHELKGSGDLDAVEGLSRRFMSGIGPDAMTYTAESLTMLRAEVERRTERLKKLPVSLCPDKKVTRHIAERRQYKLWPIACVIDECQNLFLSQHSKQAAEDAEFIAKIGPAFGVFLILATQRPDKDSLPKGISANASVRFCLKVMGHIENDMVLGTSAHANGIRATMFRTATPTDRADAGMGWLVGGDSGVPTVTRTFYLDVPAAQAIAARARKLREAAGTLPRASDGEVQARNVPADILAALGADTASQWPTLAERLAGLYPDRWGGTTGEALSEQARALGVPSVPVKREGSVRQGCRRADVEHLAAV